MSSATEHASAVALEVDTQPQVSEPLPIRGVTSVRASAGDIPSMSKSPKARAPRRDSTATHNGLKLDTRYQQLLSSHLFSPRPYEAIYAERAYLTRTLEMQSSRATDLIRRYSFAEEQLQGPITSKPRRRLRKQLGLLRSKMNDAATQERTVLIRLSELYMETHSRDTWGLAQLERMTPMSACSGGLCSPYMVYPSPASPAAPMSPLNAASPVFVPGRQYVDSPSVERAWVPMADEDGTGTRLETVEEGCEDGYLEDAGQSNVAGSNEWGEDRGGDDAGFVETYMADAGNDDTSVETGMSCSCTNDTSVYGMGFKSVEDDGGDACDDGIEDVGDSRGKDTNMVDDVRVDSHTDNHNQEISTNDPPDPENNSPQDTDSSSTIPGPFLNNHCLTYEYRGISKEDDPRPSRWLAESGGMAQLKRRLSVPSLCSIWPDV